MKPNEIFRKTMKFVWIKLLVGLLLAIGLTVFAGLCVLLIVAIDNSTAALVIMFIGVIVIGGVYHFVNSYISYMIKAAHVAVVTEAVISGVIPANQFEYGKAVVKSRFVTSNVFYLVDHAVKGAVSQLQKAVGSVGDLLSAVPGMGVITGVVQLFIGISLSYVDECCLGWTFHKKEENACKSAADGVVIYFQNWKAILKTAAITSLIVIGIEAAVTIVFTLTFLGIFSALKIPYAAFIAFILSVMIAVAIKKAFIDSFMMIKMMVTYMNIAPNTVITFDLYGKLCNMSRSFKKLFDNAGAASPQYSQPVQNPVPQNY